MYLFETYWLLLISGLLILIFEDGGGTRCRITCQKEREKKKQPRAVTGKISGLPGHILHAAIHKL